MIVKSVYSYLGLIVLLSFLLRIFLLDSYPVALHGDELGVGYNAYSLLKAGIDERGNRLPVSFRADITPLIFYLTIPSIGLFGLNEFASRFDSVVIGVLLVFCSFFFAIELARTSPDLWKKRSIVALLTCFFIGIAPWHMQISRIAHDAPYALLLQMIATIFFFRFARFNKLIYVVGSFFLFALSIYGYHSAKLTSPLLLITLGSFFQKELKNRLQLLVFCGLLFLIFTSPIMFDFFSKPFYQTRFGGINIFNGTQRSFYSILQLPPTVFVSMLNQFNPIHLFFDTSGMRYFFINGSGLLLSIELPLIIIGLFSLRRQRKLVALCLVWLGIAALPGGLTSGPPNGGRILMMLPVLQLLTGVGLNTIAVRLIRLSVGMVGIITISFGIFLYRYFILSPQDHRMGSQWQYGVKEIIIDVLQNESGKKQIVLSDKIKQGYIYLLFYGKKDPVWLTSARKTFHPILGYTTLLSYEFRPISWQSDRLLSKSLIAGSTQEIPASDRTIINEVSSANKLYRMVETQ